MSGTSSAAPLSYLSKRDPGNWRNLRSLASGPGRELTRCTLACIRLIGLTPASIRHRPQCVPEHTPNDDSQYASCTSACTISSFAILTSEVGFRLGSHKFPVALGRRTGVARELRFCQHCVQGVVGDELHMTFECPHLQSLRDQFSHLFGPTTTDMRSFFSQQDKVSVIKFTMGALGLATDCFAFGHM